MTFPRHSYAGYHGVFGALTRADRRFMRFIYSALAALVVLALVVDAVLSPLNPPAPRPKPANPAYYKALSWETMALYYLLGLVFYGLVMLMALIQDGSVQRLWVRWRWSLWQRHGQAALLGEAPVGLYGRLASRLFDTEKLRLDTFYQWLSAANRAFEEGRLAEAADSYRRAAALRPASAVARVNLGAALGRMGRHREALDAFRGVLGADPTNGDALKNAALALLRLGRAGEAEELVASHLSMHPRDAEAWWLAARCRAARPGARAEAVVEALMRACRLEPARREALLREEEFAPYLEHPALSALLLKTVERG